jgi:hypothetical protein
LTVRAKPDDPDHTDTGETVWIVCNAKLGAIGAGKRSRKMRRPMMGVIEVLLERITYSLAYCALRQLMHL